MVKIEVKNKIGHADSIKLKRMKPYIKPTKPHQHKDYHEIILISSGEGFHTIEFEKHTVQPPVIFALKPGQVHQWEFTEKPEGFVLMFKQDFLNNHFLNQTNPVNIKSCIEIDATLCDHLSYLLLSIGKELDQKNDRHSNLAIAAYLKLILLELDRFSTDHNQTMPALSSRFHQFDHLVKAHYRTQRKVTYYAELLHMTPKHLNDICKSNKGLTASEVIQNHVITEAKRLLIYTDMSISEITSDLGFDDSSHFAKYFRRQLHVSPNYFRKNRFQ